MIKFELDKSANYVNKESLYVELRFDGIEIERALTLIEKLKQFYKENY